MIPLNLLKRRKANGTAAVEEDADDGRRVEESGVVQRSHLRPAAPGEHVRTARYQILNHLTTISLYSIQLLWLL